MPKIVSAPTSPLPVESFLNKKGESLPCQVDSTLLQRLDYLLEFAERGKGPQIHSSSYFAPLVPLKGHSNDVNKYFFFSDAVTSPLARPLTANLVPLRDDNKATCKIPIFTWDERATKSATSICKWWRSMLKLRLREAKRLQSLWRGYVVRQGLYASAMVAFSACVEIQSILRGALARSEQRRRNRCAIRLQAMWRYCSQRSYFRSLLGAVLAFQTRLRRRIHRRYLGPVLIELIARVKEIQAARYRRVLAMLFSLAAAAKFLVVLKRSRLRIKSSVHINRIFRGRLAIISYVALKAHAQAIEKLRQLSEEKAIRDACRMTLRTVGREKNDVKELRLRLNAYRRRAKKKIKLLESADEKRAFRVDAALAIYEKDGKIATQQLQNFCRDACIYLEKSNVRKIRESATQGQIPVEIIVEHIKRTGATKKALSAKTKVLRLVRRVAYAYRWLSGKRARQAVYRAHNHCIKSETSARARTAYRELQAPDYSCPHCHRAFALYGSFYRHTKMCLQQQLELKRRQRILAASCGPGDAKLTLTRAKKEQQRPTFALGPYSYSLSSPYIVSSA